MGYYLLFSTVVYVFYFQHYCLFGILFPANRVSFIVCKYVLDFKDNANFCYNPCLFSCLRFLETFLSFRSSPWIYVPLTVQ